MIRNLNNKPTYRTDLQELQRLLVLGTANISGKNLGGRVERDSGTQVTLLLLDVLELLVLNPHNGGLLLLRSYYLVLESCD